MGAEEGPGACAEREKPGAVHPWDLAPQTSCGEGAAVWGGGGGQAGREHSGPGREARALQLCTKAVLRADAPPAGAQAAAPAL